MRKANKGLSIAIASLSFVLILVCVCFISLYSQQPSGFPSFAIYLNACIYSMVTLAGLILILSIVLTITTSKIKKEKGDFNKKASIAVYLTLSSINLIGIGLVAILVLSGVFDGNKKIYLSYCIASSISIVLMVANGIFNCIVASRKQICKNKKR